MFSLKKFRNHLHQWVEKNHEKKPQLGSFNIKIALGILFIAGSFLVGWGGPGLAAYQTIKNPDQAVFWIGLGAISYGSSWGIWALGMFLTGKANYEFGRYYLARWIKKKGWHHRKEKI